MSRSAEKKLIADAMQLDLKARARVVRHLAGTLDGEPEEGVEEAWAEVIDERVARYLDGSSVPIPSEEAERQIQEVLAKHRRR